MEDRKRGNAIGQGTRDVGAQIEALRKDEGLSLEALSHRLTDLGRPIHVSGLSKLENGERRIDVDDLVALSQALGVSIVDLIAPATALGDAAALRALLDGQEFRRVERFWRKVSAFVDEDREAYDLPKPNYDELFERRIERETLAIENGKRDRGPSGND